MATNYSHILFARKFYIDKLLRRDDTTELSVDKYRLYPRRKRKTDVTQFGEVIAGPSASIMSLDRLRITNLR